jgi:hypothetical protein
MLRRSSVSRSRALLQRAVAVIGITGAVFTGSVATSSAGPHFSTTGPLTTSMAGPAHYILLDRPGQPTVTITCPTLALTAGPAAGNSTMGGLTWVGVNTTSACTGSNGYPYTITSDTVDRRWLLHNGSYFYFDFNNVTWHINGGGPTPANREFHPAPYIMKWLNPDASHPFSSMFLAGVPLGTSVGTGWNAGWTAKVTGAWKVEQAGNLITALL